MSTPDAPLAAATRSERRRPGTGSGYAGPVRVWVLVALFAMVTAARSVHVGIPPRDPGGSILVLRVAISLALFAVLALVDAAVRTPRLGWRPGRVVGVLRARWTRDRLLLAWSGLLAYHLVYFCYHNLKSWDVFNHVRDTMVQDTQARYLAQRAHLLVDPQAHDAFAQVSAFASLHVAVTCFLLLMTRYYRLRWATRVMSVYLVGTMLATVYLGWHFAVDDIAGLAIAVAAVLLGRLMVHPTGVSRDLRGLRPWRA
jgi:membrane-associated phospholipid phosphatase